MGGDEERDRRGDVKVFKPVRVLRWLSGQAGINICSFYQFAEPEPDVVEYKAADKSLRFYKPDAYKGIEEPSQAPSQTLKLDWV